MKTMSAKDAKNGFGLLLDTARAEPVLIEKHNRPFVVVLSVEEFDRLADKAARADAPEVTRPLSKAPVKRNQASLGRKAAARSNENYR